MRKSEAFVPIVISGIDVLIAKPGCKFLMYINQLLAMLAKAKDSVTQP